MTELPNVETLSPPPTDAEVGWWNHYRRRKRWRGIVTRFVFGVSAFGLYFMIRSLGRQHRVYELCMAVVGGAVVAMAPRPNTLLFDEMTAAIRDRRVREALRAPPRE
jgi:hypothetical protein